MHSLFPAQALVDEAASWEGVRETGPNEGPEVDLFQKSLESAPGLPWCGAFAWYCIRQVEHKLGIRSRLFPSSHVLTMWNRSPEDCRLIIPEFGALMLWRKPPGISGHCGIVAQVETPRLAVIEGNTNSMGSRDGDGVYRNWRSLYGDARLMTLGWLRVFG